jgi:hypothetical protein
LSKTEARLNRSFPAGADGLPQVIRQPIVKNCDRQTKSIRTAQSLYGTFACFFVVDRDGGPKARSAPQLRGVFAGGFRAQPQLHSRLGITAEEFRQI